MLYLGHVIENDVGLVRMQCQIILVMLFGWIELWQRHDLRDDGVGKSARGGELLDVALRNFLLLIAGVEDRRTLLAAGIRALAIKLSGVVRHAEKYLQQLLIGNLRRIETDAHRFGMPGIAIAD